MPSMRVVGQRAGAKCPVRCADVELVGAELIAILAEINL